MCQHLTADPARTLLDTAGSDMRRQTGACSVLCVVQSESSSSQKKVRSLEYVFQVGVCLVLASKRRAPGWIHDGRVHGRILE